MNKLCIRAISFSLASCILLTACGYKKSENKEQVNQETSISQDNDFLEHTIPTEIGIIIEENKNVDEEEILGYFENQKEKLGNYLSSENINGFNEKIKNTIIDGIDFIFYGKEINGITFEELSEETKEKILKIVVEMDIMIESRKPGYKEEIKSSFGRFKDAAKKNISNIDETLKNAFGDSYDDLKELIGASGEVALDVAETGIGILDSGFTYIKEWYEKETGK